MRTVNGIHIYWRDLDDLPTMCGSYPFYYDGTTSAPGAKVYETGVCNLRGMMKGRWTNTPKQCTAFFRRIMKQPDGARYVIVLKDSEQ